MLLSWPWWVYLFSILLAIALRVVIQRRHTLQHNFSFVEHLRFIIEIIRAASCEHSCRFTIEDVEIAKGDNSHTLSLLLAYGCTKDTVAIDRMDALFSCSYLGGIRPDVPIEHET